MPPVVRTAVLEPRTPVEEGRCSGAGLGTSPGQCYRSDRQLRSPVSQVSATVLLTLDRLEQGLEVALAEAERSVPLDQLEEHRRPVLHGLGEDLQQIPVLVPVDQDGALLELLDGHAHLTDAGSQLGVVVVRVWRGQEL